MDASTSKPVVSVNLVVSLIIIYILYKVAQEPVSLLTMSKDVPAILQSSFMTRIRCVWIFNDDLIAMLSLKAFENLPSKMYWHIFYARLFAPSYRCPVCQFHNVRTMLAGREVEACTPGGWGGILDLTFQKKHIGSTGHRWHNWVWL